MPDRGPNGRYVGTFGRAGAFSFYATKTITTGEGGMLVTDDDGIADRARRHALHGISRDAWNRYAANGSWYYEIEDAGYKYNMTDIAAAMGLAQLERATELLAARRSIAAAYTQAFQSSAAADLLELPEDAPDGSHAWHLYIVRLELDRLASIGLPFSKQSRPRDRCQRSLHSAALAPVLPATLGQSARRSSRGHEGIRASHFTADLAWHDGRRCGSGCRDTVNDPRARTSALSVVGQNRFTLADYPDSFPGSRSRCSSHRRSTGT